MYQVQKLFIKAPKSVSTPNVLVPPDPFFPTPSTPATKTLDAWRSGPAESLVQSEETTENTESDPDAAEPAAEGDTKMKYSSDWLCSPNTGVVTKTTCRNLTSGYVPFQNLE